MTISYTLQPNFEWYFPDLTGEALGLGKMYTYSSLNPNQPKPVYQDPAGLNQWPNPIIFSLNGTSGPFYWKLDSGDPDDLYFIQIYDRFDNLVYSINQYPIAGGGGGGTINTIQNLENIFVNSSFIHNIGVTTTQPIQDQTILSPGSHSGLLYPDISFIQSGVSNANDTITFSLFTPTGINPLSPDFCTPYFLNYLCTNNPSGEVYKGIRIPISPYVNTISNQTFTFLIYGRVNSGADTLTVRLKQYFGTGGSPSSEVLTTLSTITLTGSFAIYSVNFSVPSVATKNLGDSNDDGTYIEILFPVSQACDIDLAKPMLYQGSVFPNISFESIEEIESKLETPRTGDIKMSSNAFSNSSLQYGWIPLNDGTIGNQTSNATTRARDDTWLLYNQLWYGTSATNCPIFDSSGNPVVKGGTSLSDWNNNRQLQLPRTTGRVIANRGTGTITSLSYTTLSNYIVVSSTSAFRSGDPISFSVAAPTRLLLDTTYYVGVASATQLVVYTSAELAIALGPENIFFNDGTNGTINTPPTYDLARFQGEMGHELVINEMPAHNHPGSTLDNGSANASSGGGGLTNTFLLAGGSGNTGLNIASQGGDYPHNTMQPTVFYNMIIKL